MSHVNRLQIMWQFAGFCTKAFACASSCKRARKTSPSSSMLSVTSNPQSFKNKGLPRRLAHSDPLQNAHCQPIISLSRAGTEAAARMWRHYDTHAQQHEPALPDKPYSVCGSNGHWPKMKAQQSAFDVHTVAPAQPQSAATAVH